MERGGITTTAFSTRKQSHKTLDGVEIILLELQKFHPRNRAEKRLGVLWLRFLKEITSCQTIPKEFKESPEIVKACELVQESAYNKAELRAYNEYRNAVQIEATLLEDRFERGEAKGREEGRAEVAKALMGILDDENIAKATGLSLAEVQSLRSGG